MVAAGNQHTLVLKAGAVYSIGDAGMGRLGLDNARGHSQGRINFGNGDGTKIGFITCGPDHSVAVGADGYTLYCWGACDEKGVGHPLNSLSLDSGEEEEKENGLIRRSKDSIPTPQPFFCWLDDGLSSARRIIQVSCGAQHTLALRDDGKVYSWSDRRLRSRLVARKSVPGGCSYSCSALSSQGFGSSWSPRSQRH
jgi:hypothetical protein